MSLCVSLTMITFLHGSMIILNVKLLWKKTAHANYKKSGFEFDRLSFVNLLVKCKRLSKDAHERYLHKVESSLNRNPKYFWKYVRNLKTSNHLLTTVHLNNTEATNPLDSVNLFSEHFRSVYTPPLNPNELPDLRTLPTIALNHIEISISEIIDCLLHFNLNSGSGPDLIPNYFLTACTFSLAWLLHTIFSKSLNTGVFPV